MIPLLKEALAILSTILGIAQQILGITAKTALEHSPYALETIAANAANTVNNPTYGNNAIHLEHVEVISLLATLQSSINSIRASQSGDDTVILPTTPPAGYGGGTLTASEVWDATYQTTGVTFADLLARAGTHAWWLAFNGSIPLAGAPHFRYELDPRIMNGTGNPPIGAIRAPQPDYSDIRVGDTVLSWLQRTDTYWEDLWYLDGFTGACVVDYNYADPSEGGRILCTLRDPDLALLAGGSGASMLMAPVWPGLAAVTLGNPVALDTGLTITEPMDGVLVAITSVPGKHSGYTYDDIKSYVHIGALAFFSDNADMESYQPLSFTAQVYRTRTMARAAGVKVMTPPDVVGLITPWVVT